MAVLLLAATTISCTQDLPTPDSASTVKSGHDGNPPSTDGIAPTISMDPSSDDRVANIILLIGDGMGPHHITAARYLSEGPEGFLSMEDMPVTGLARTHSANDLFTDSAAAATAIASGVKTNNGAIGVDAAGNSVSTILEIAQSLGKSTGLVTDTQITHATPAAFSAHIEDRNMMTEIAKQQLDLEVDVLLGGGEDEWLPADQVGCYPEPGERSDGLNLVEMAVSLGYTYVCTAEQLEQLEPSRTTRLLGLFGDEGLVRPHQPSLADMTWTAIQILSTNPYGFFLMVEGGQIDWASESNDANNTLTDVLNFDRAVAEAQDFASRHPGTLVIVTADHESGGLSLVKPKGADATFRTPDGISFGVGWSTKSHTAVDVLVFAQGPQAWKLGGTFPNTHIYDVMVEALK